MPRGRSPARAAAAADAAATPSAEVASPTFSPPAFPSSRDPLVAVAQAGAQLAVANANVVAARPVVPIEISLAGDAPGAPLVVVDVRAGMARDELEQCIAFAFKRRHKVGAVAGVIVPHTDGGHPTKLVPLGVVAAAPEALLNVPCVLACEHAYRRETWKARLARVAAEHPRSCGLAVVLVLAWLLGVPILSPVMLEPHLRSLYRGGPCLSIGGVSVGFWEGAATHDVCARLTAHEAAFWAQHPGECEQIVARKEAAFVIGAEYALCALVAWKLASLVVSSKLRGGGRGRDKAK